MAHFGPELRTDVVDVGVDGSRRQDELLASDDLESETLEEGIALNLRLFKTDFCIDSDNHRGLNSVHDIGIAGLADAADAAVLDADVRLENANYQLREER